MKTKKTTQRQRLLDWFNNEGSISSFEAYRELGVTQLGTRIWEMKQEGFDIVTEWEHGTNRYGEPVKWKRYSLRQPKQGRLAL
jgi:hypothetical protein